MFRTDLPCDFIRGDSNGNITVDLGDVIFILYHLFVAPQSLRCEDAADANDDGQLNVADPAYTLNHLFTSVWIADVIWWWLRGHEAYRRRPRWIGILTIKKVTLIFHFRNLCT